MLSFSDTHIETQRLILRPLESEDATELLAIFSDPEVMKYWNTPPWASIEDALDFVAANRVSMQDGEGLTLGIFTQSPPQLIGKCMLFSYEKSSRRAELGFGIGAPFWGKGYIQEAGQALIEHAFMRIGLRRLEAEIDPGNIASAKALERLGFIEEGFLRARWEIDGVVSDSALYGLLLDDWQAQRL